MALAQTWPSTNIAGWSVQPVSWTVSGETAIVSLLSLLMVPPWKLLCEWLTSMTMLQLSHRLRLPCRYLNIQLLAPATHWSLLVMQTLAA